MRINKRIHVCLFGMVYLIICGIFAHSADIQGFTPIKKIGDCRIKSEYGYDVIVLGTIYEFNRTVKTGRKSLLDLEFSDGNSFRLLARSTITITEDVQNPKLKILQVSQGSIDVRLDEFPADHKLQG